MVNVLRIGQLLFYFLPQTLHKIHRWSQVQETHIHATGFLADNRLENNNLNFNNLRKDYWTPENPTNASAQPSNMGTYRSKAGSWGNAKSEMSHTMFSSNFLKISYITLGYTFKPSVLEKMKLGNLRLYATVQNPFIFCAKDVVDPEQLNVSINTSDAMTRNVIFGINLSFK